MTGLASIYDGREKPWHCSCALVISSDVYDRSPLEKLEKIVAIASAITINTRILPTLAFIMVCLACV